MSEEQARTMELVSERLHCLAIAECDVVMVDVSCCDEVVRFTNYFV